MADDERSDQSQRSSVKKTTDSNETRRRKADNTLTIRKNKRLESVQKRRQSTQQAVVPELGGEEDSAPPPPTSRFDPESAFLTRAVENSVIYEKKQEVLYDAEEMPKVLRALGSSDRRLRTTATAHLRKLLSIEVNPPISQVTRQPGVVARLVSFLSHDDDPALQFEAAWALTNIASGTPEQTRTVIEHDAIPAFVRLLSSPNDDVREQSVWALGNIAGDGAKCRERVLTAGVLEPLIRCVYTAKRLTMLRNATWAISNLSRGKPPPAFSKVKPFLSVLSRLVFSVDDEVLTDACWALSYLSVGSNERVQALIESGVCRRLVELLMHAHVGVVIPALRTIGNVVTGDDLQTQVVVDAHAIPALVEALYSKKKGIKKEACWTLSNITAGDRNQIQRVIEANAVKPLIGLLRSGEFDIKKEAAWALSNACSGGTERQIHAVATQGFIPPLLDLLSINDPRMTVVGLDALDKILEAGKADANRKGSTNQYVTQVEKAKGIEKLEQLLTSNNDDLFRKSSDILKTYFNRTGPAEDSSIAPATRDGAFEFAPGSSDLDDSDIDDGFGDDTW